MPVVTLNLSRLQNLISAKTNKNKIISTIPFLGLDIEDQTKDEIRVEYSPNRPDFATDYGIAEGLRGLFGRKKGIIKLKIKKGNYKIKVDSSVKKVRPYITAIVAKNGKLDEHTIKQLITLQEDLHFGIGRNRKKSSIGMHDLDKIEFPLRYIAANKNHKFIPLDSTNEMTAEEVLSKTNVGQEYTNLLENSPKIPIIIDSKENTVPISNNFCGYCSCTFRDKFSIKLGNIESRRMAWSSLFEPTTSMISDVLLLVKSYWIFLFTKLEFSASVYPKPTKIIRRESSCLVTVFFCPTDFECGNDGFKFSIP